MTHTHTVDGWRAYYTDDRQYDSVTDTWTTLPDDGLLVVVVYFDAYSGDGDVQHTFIHDGADWYGYDGAELFVSNQQSIAVNRRRYPDCTFKQGQWTTRSEYRAVKARAIDAPAPS